MRLARVGWLTMCLVSGLTPQLWAQPVPSREPSSTHIFPAGGRRGSTVHVLVGGECLPPETGFRIWGQGVSAQPILGAKHVARLESEPRREPREVPICYPKEWDSVIEIASDAPVGSRPWRLTCARGGTSSRPFIVGELDEFIETESNSLPQLAERVQLPVTVNGRIAGERDLDYFVFSAKAGEVVVCDTVAGRIGSPLDPVLEITDPDGQRIEYEEVRLGSDPIVVFRAAAAGDYRLMIANVSFHGSLAHVYRMTIRAIANAPAIEGAELMVWLLDRGLVPSVLPASESSRQDSETDPGIALLASRERAANVLTLPAMVRTRLHTASDEQVFRFRAEADQALAITCRAFPAGLAALPELAVIGEDGRIFAESKSVASDDRECQIEWKPPHGGEFRVQLRDARRGSQPTAECGYELSLAMQQPDFTLELRSDSVNVVQGGRTELELRVRRSGGFVGPIHIIADGLPDGVHAEPLEVASNASTAKFMLSASADARPTDAVFRILGRSPLDGVTLQRSAVSSNLGRDFDGSTVGVSKSDRLYLTVQHPPVFRLFCNEAYQYAHRGTIYPYGMQIERLNGFDGEVTIQLGDRQNRDLDGVQFVEVTVPPGATDVAVPIYLPESMHINVVSQSQIYAQGYAIFNDRWGQRQSMLVVSEKRNMIRTLPTVAKLSAAEREITAAPGSTVVCSLTLERSSNFTGPMLVELVEPSETLGFKCRPVPIESDARTVQLAVELPANAAVRDGSELRFRARGELSPGVAVISESTVKLSVDKNN